MCYLNNNVFFKFILSKDICVGVFYHFSLLINISWGDDSPICSLGGLKIEYQMQNSPKHMVKISYGPMTLGYIPKQHISDGSSGLQPSEI